VGTVNGLDILTFAPFELFNLENSGVSNYVLAFTEDNSGRVWIGTYSGLYYYEKASESHVRLEIESNFGKHADTRIVALANYDGGLLLGHFESGIEYLNESKKKSPLIADPRFKQMSITRIIVDSDNIWIATYDHGLFRIRGPQTYSYLENGTLPERSITLIFQSHDKVIFAVSENRLFRYAPENDRFEELILDFGLDKKHPSIYSLSESQADDILIGTKDHGLFFWQQNNNENGIVALVPANSNGELATSTIYGVEPDQSGNLWCSTQNGIVKLDSRGRLIKRFSTADGLQGKDFAFGASFQSREGVIYFGGTNGYNRFNPKQIAVETDPSRMRLTGIILPGRNFKHIGAGDELHSLQLTHKDHYVTFQFSVLDFIDPERNQFRYKLENFNTDWIENGTSNTATFTNLPAGDYTLRIQGANSAGVWNRDGLSLAVTVLPAPWLTWWAYSLYTVTLFCLAWALHRIYHSYVVERRSAELALEMFEAENKADDDMQEQLEMQDEWVSSAHLHSQTTLSLISDSIAIRNADQSGGTSDNLAASSMRRIAALHKLEDCLCYQAGGPLANLHKYTDELLPVLLEKSPIAPETIITINEVTATPIPVELASPLAVIIYELLENCFQHAFEPDSPANYVHVKLSQVHSDVAPYRKLELSIHDNGMGMPADVENLGSECCGIALVKSIVAKLGGTLTVTVTSGTLCSVEIPDLQYA
jgi:two-component sensor histidine kinase/streptogramin lyase